MIKSRGYLALQLQPVIERRKVLLTPAAGLMIAALAIIFNEVTGKGTDEVLSRRERPGPPHPAGRHLVGRRPGPAHHLQTPSPLGRKHAQVKAMEGDDAYR
jgi:hypothetical protein